MKQWYALYVLLCSYGQHCFMQLVRLMGSTLFLMSWKRHKGCIVAENKYIWRTVYAAVSYLWDNPMTVSLIFDLNFAQNTTIYMCSVCKISYVYMYVDLMGCYGLTISFEVLNQEYLGLVGYMVWDVNGPGRCGCNIKLVIFKRISSIGFYNIFYEISHR